MAFNRTTFDNHVTAGNPDYRRAASSLKGLMEVLDRWPHQATPGEIVEEMAKVPTAKQQNRYQAAFDYLRKNFPGGIPEAALPGPGRAIPVRFCTKLHEYRTTEQYATVFDAAGQNPELVKGLTKHHAIFECKWSSSSGNLGDLATVASRELCRYRTPPNDPPFNRMYDFFVRDHPNLEYAQPAQSLSNKMNLGVNHDDHSVNDPNMLCCNPRQVGQLVMEQVYQYNLTNDPADGNWIDIPHSRFLIIKEILNAAGHWTFRWTKKHALGNREKLLYSYDVKLGPPPAKLPKQSTDLTL